MSSGLSFDCASPSTQTERTICANPGLVALDRKYAEILSRALAVARKLDTDRDIAEREIRVSDSLFVVRRELCGTFEQCIANAYERQIALVEAGWLRRGGPPAVFICDNLLSNMLVAIFVDTDPPSVRLERGDTRVIAVAVPTEFGMRYIADNGYSFWTRGPEAIVEWPLGTHLKCAK